MFESTYTYFEVLAIRWSYLHLFWATCNYSKHFQLFEASNTYFRSYLHIFRATCNYLKYLALISSLLQLFETSRNYLEPLAVIWSLRQLRGSCNYLKLHTYFKPPAIIWSFSHLFKTYLRLFSSFLHLFWASCRKLRLLTPFFECLTDIWNF